MVSSTKTDDGDGINKECLIFNVKTLSESSIHFKILSLGEALRRLNWMSYKIKQQFNDGVRCDDSVWFYTSSNTLL